MTKFDCDRTQDTLKIKAFIGRIGSALSIQHLHFHAPGVMQCKQIPLLVKYGTARAAALGGRPVMHPRFLVVKKQIVIYRIGQAATAGCTMT